MDYKKSFKIERYSYADYENYVSKTKRSVALSFIMATENTFCLDIERKQGAGTIQLAEGDLCVLMPDTQFRFYTLPETRSRIVIIELSQTEGGRTLEKLARDCAPLSRLLQNEREYVVFSASSELKSLMILLQNCHEKQHKIGEEQESLSCLINALVCKTAEEIECKPRSALLCAHTNKAIAYIAKNYKDNITLSSLCKAVGIGERRMQMLFRDELSTTFGEYLSNYRVSKACELLRNGAFSVESVAASVGYNSRQHFAHTFKAIVGMSPQQFRAKVKNRSYLYNRENLGSLAKAFLSFDGSIVE